MNDPNGVNTPVQHTVQVHAYDPSVPVTGQPTGWVRARDTATMDNEYIGRAFAKDPDGQPVYYGFLDSGGFVVNEVVDAAADDPQGLTIDRYTGRITWMPSDSNANPSAGDVFSYSVIFTDEISIFSAESPPLFGGDYTPIGPFDITIVNHHTNVAPVITSSPDDVYTGSNSSLNYLATYWDEDNDSATWSIVDGPSTASINPVTGEFYWLPAETDFGKTRTAIIQIKDSYEFSDQQELTLKARRTTNTAPEIVSIPPQPGLEHQAYHYLVRAKDVDGERVRFEVDNYNFTLVDNGDGTAVVYIEDPDDISYTFTVSAIDERDLAGKQTVTLIFGTDGSVSVVDTPPEILSRPPLSAPIDKTYYHQIVAIDPDATLTDPITYNFTLTPVGGGAAIGFDTGEFDPVTGLIRWVPDVTEIDTYDATIEVTQDSVISSYSYRLQVFNPSGANNPPSLQTVLDLETSPGNEFAFDVPVYDIENDPLTFFLVDSATGNLVHEIDGMSITPNGRVTWSVPATIQLDGNATRTFQVHVQDVNNLPADLSEAYTEEYTVTIVPDKPPTISLSVSTRLPMLEEVVRFAIQATDDQGKPDVRLVVHQVWDGSRVAMGRCRPTAPTDPDVRALAHPVPQPTGSPPTSGPLSYSNK